MNRLNNWLQNRPPEPDATGWFELRKAKKETPTIICVGCEQRVPLWDEMEECFATPEILQRVRDMQEESKIVLDNESKESALVGEVISTVALAGQICREFNVATTALTWRSSSRTTVRGHRRALSTTQVRRFLPARGKKRRRGNFTIKDERHARYWMAQDSPSCR